jgi:hypothetical protein
MYGSLAPNAMWVSSKALAKQDVKCPLPQTNPAASAKDALASFLPPDLSVQDFVRMVRAGQVCEVGQRVNSNMTCDEFQVCFALIHNTVTMQAWGLTNNSMWDYAAIDTYYENNFDSFLEYWPMYDATENTSRPLYNITQGAHQPFVYGTVGYRDGVHELYAQTLPNMIRGVADATFGKPQGGRTGRAVMTTLWMCTTRSPMG